MLTNPLIRKTGVGRVKKCTFTHPTKDTVFGLQHHADAEGAREVVGFWKDNATTPAHAKPTGPDYRAMNKLAAVSGLTTSDGQLAFRASHPITLKNGMAVHKPPPPLPSDRDPWHTYGSAPDFRSMEQIRVTGRDSPSIQSLVQGAYQRDWVAAAKARQKISSQGPHRGLGAAMRATTKATRGHEAGARRALGRGTQPPSTLDAFKLSKFKRVAPRTDTFRRPAPAAAR